MILRDLVGGGGRVQLCLDDPEHQLSWRTLMDSPQETLSLLALRLQDAAAPLASVLTGEHGDKG